MIVDIIQGDIFKTPHKHIAFATNTEGYNDAGFAGTVAFRYWPELTSIGPNKLGKVISKKIKGKIFHALVCHSLGSTGWRKTPQIITKCLDLLDVPDDETIAIVLVGTGGVGQIGGADVFSILGGMARSKKRIAVYTR
jgi:hypothetical protein